MPTAQLSTMTMYYETHGAGTPLVLIAGFSADHHAWDNVVAEFAKHYQVITLDNRGAGQSSVPNDDYSIAMMAHDIAELCQHLNIRSCHVIGSSMGGMIAQQLCHEYPELVTSAVIANSGMNSHCGFELCVETHLAMRQASIDEAVIARSNCSWVFSQHHLAQPGNLEQAMADYQNNPNPFTITGYLGQRSALNPFDSQPWVDQIKQPTLVIGSDEDLIFTANKSKALAESLAHATYLEFSQCGHLPFIEYPQQFSVAVLSFLEKNNPMPG